MYRSILRVWRALLTVLLTAIPAFAEEPVGPQVAVSIRCPAARIRVGHEIGC